MTLLQRATTPRYRGPDLRPETRCRVLRPFTFREERITPEGVSIPLAPARVVEVGETIHCIDIYARGWAQRGLVQIL